MTWYVASGIFMYRPVTGVSANGFLVHENFYLVQADSHDAAIKCAVEIARSNVVDDPTQTIDDVPAVYEFLGIRKTVEISNPLEVDEEEGPVHGTELTYSEYGVDSVEDAMKLTRDESVVITYY
jgi:hypothetical protein